VEEVLRRFPRVRIVRHEERAGASPTKAHGAQQARGDVLVFLDGHTHPVRDAIWRLVKDVEELKGNAVVTPAIPALDVKKWKNDASPLKSMMSSWKSPFPAKPSLASLSR
jgi:hypothetical protein